MLYIKATLIIIILFIPASTFALRCGTDLVLKGDRKIEVIKACGEPEFIEKWHEETVTHVTHEKDEIRGDLIVGSETVIGKSRTIRIEEWTYNFGSSSFIRYLTFINGILKKIEDGPKGFNREVLSGYSKSRCGYLVEKGDRKIEVIINCGDPYTIDFYWEEQISAVSNAIRTRKVPQFIRDGKKFKKNFRFIKERIYEQKRKLINIEEWTYNLGPRQFLYFIKFENGKVMEVEQGDYGF